MKRLFPQLAIVMLAIVLLSFFTKIFYTCCTYESMADLRESDHAILMVSPHYTPQAGDMVSCGDGSVYTIKDVSQYQRTPAEPAFAAFLEDALSESVPEADVIHFTDISGDYLFVKNRYKMYRILCTLSHPTAIQLSIPDDAIPTVLDSWDPEWMTGFQNSHPNNTCCLECWDMYKNGSYLKTVYLAAAI